MRPLVILLTILSILVVTLLSTPARASTICPDSKVLDSLEYGRWTVLRCIEVEAEVLSSFPSSNGSYWLIVQARIDDGTKIMDRPWVRSERLWAKVYPDKYPVSRPFDGEVVKIVGTLVRDSTYQGLLSDGEIVPVVSLERGSVRDWNEYRDGNWWHVWVLKDSTYRQSLIPWWDYTAAGIK